MARAEAFQALLFSVKSSSAYAKSQLWDMSIYLVLFPRPSVLLQPGP